MSGCENSYYQYALRSHKSSKITKNCQPRKLINPCTNGGSRPTSHRRWGGGGYIRRPTLRSWKQGNIVTNGKWRLIQPDEIYNFAKKKIIFMSGQLWRHRDQIFKMVVLQENNACLRIFWTNQGRAKGTTLLCSWRRNDSKYMWIESERSSSRSDLRSRNLKGLVVSN